MIRTRRSEILHLFPQFCERLSAVHDPHTIQNNPERISLMATSREPQDAWDHKQNTRDRTVSKSNVNEIPIMATRRSRGQEPRPASTLKTFFKEERKTF